MTAALLWFLAGIALFGAELMTPALVLLFFGIGAWAAACAALLALPVDVQAAVFIVASLLSLILLRRKLRSIFSGRSGEPQTEAGHPLAGRRGIVSKPLSPGKVGEINIDGSFWRAMAEMPVPEGRTVLVQGTLPKDALVLLVHPDTTT